MKPDLSKSKIAAFEHCPKRLWLQVHRRELGHVDEKTQALFAAGHKVGELARAELPSGMLIDNDYRDVDGALSRTTASARLRRVRRTVTAWAVSRATRR